jgi:hypothetical protein
LKISNASGAVWAAKYQGSRDPDVSRVIGEQEGPRYDAIITYNNKQWEEVLVPMYRKMRDQFSTHMWLAEPSTLKHFPKLVEFVEMWDRHLAKSIPGEVVDAVGHSEKDLVPFYDDLQENFNGLTSALRK